MVKLLLCALSLLHLKKKSRICSKWFGNKNVASVKMNGFSVQLKFIALSLLQDDFIYIAKLTYNNSAAGIDVSFRVQKTHLKKIYVKRLHLSTNIKNICMDFNIYYKDEIFSNHQFEKYIHCYINKLQIAIDAIYHSFSYSVIP